MSFDILILKLKLPETENLAEVEDVLEIGQPEVIASVINEYFPNCLESYFMAEKGYSFEASLNGSPVESVHATLRFGNNWSELASNEFYSLFKLVCLRLGCVAFAVSDNSRICP